MSYLLEVRDLVKQYPEVRAVDGLSLGIAPGICFGLLGPNGAGKTTTIEILEGVTTATSGEVFFRGEPRDAGYREAIGIQFQSTALQDFQTVREALVLFRGFYRKRADLDEIVALCHLEDLLGRDTRRLSGGQRQRLLLAIALINDPELVFLDEPTTGLDPQSRRNFWDLIDMIRRRGKTILLTTHYMDEAEILCDEIAIVDRGRIVAQGSPRQLLAEHFAGALIRLPVHAVDDCGRLPGQVTQRREQVEIATDDVNGTISALQGLGVALHELRITRPTLDDLFLKLTGRALRG
ncbi:MAG: ABC transporter ATP-binding protein [Thiotrichales bacterium]